MPVLETIREFLAANGVPFKEVHHPPTNTSAESAAARGEDLRTGGKALLMKADVAFQLFVLPADRKIDSSAIRKRLGIKRLRFATPEELLELTGLRPGSVPPFGRPVLPLDLYVDDAIAENPRIAFNAGSPTDSIMLATADYLRVARPVDCFRFSSVH